MPRIDLSYDVGCQNVSDAREQSLGASAAPGRHATSVVRMARSRSVLGRLKFLCTMAAIVTGCGDGGEAATTGCDDNGEAVVTGCSESGGGSRWSGLDERPCPDDSTLTWENLGVLFMMKHCTSCHSYLDNVEVVRDLAPRIWSVAADQNDVMPPRLVGTESSSSKERASLGEWLACGARTAEDLGLDPKSPSTPVTSVLPLTP